MNERRLSRQLGKQIHRNLVLNLIKAGPTSRTEIAEETGLSPATVSNLTLELMSEGLVHETGVVETSRGRPPVLLRLNNQARFVVGVKVMPSSLVAVVTDLDANVVATRTVEGRDRVDGHDGLGGTAAYPTPEDLISALAQLVDVIVADASIPRADLLGVGIGLAGIIDGAAGICRYSPFFGWRDVDLVTPLRAHLDMDVQLANDVDALTIAEQWFGHGRGIDDFVVVTVGRGVGAGLVLNGRFYGGRRGGVGEIAHITMLPEGPPCACGRYGCLEAMASDMALIRAVHEAIGEGRSTAMSLSEDLTLATIVRAAEAGDRLARELLASAGQWLGRGVAMLVNLLHPQLVIVAGEGVEAGEWRLKPMRRALERARFDVLGARTRLVIESAGDTTWARGAACVVLGEFFKSPLHQDRAAAEPVGAAG